MKHLIKIIGSCLLFLITKPKYMKRAVATVSENTISGIQRRRNMLLHTYPVTFFVLLLLLSSGLSAQQADTTTSDGLLQSAKNAAFREDNYPLAKYYCQKALVLSPDYSDIRILLGRIYSWTKSYDSAKTCFTTVLKAHPDYEDASLALADMEYWNDQNKEALETVDTALSYHPDSQALLLRKAKILTAEKQYRKADSLVTLLLHKNKQNTEALSLAGRIKDDISVNKIGLTYDYVHFDQAFPSNDPWHLVSFSYTRHTGLGSIAANINYANRFQENGIQYELEAYPRISRTFYCYVEGGYSDNVGVFPQWRSGFSLYANLPKSFEAEAGWRYLYFSDPTNIFTAYIGKYYKNYLFGLRTYLTPGASSLSQSYTAMGRYYFGGADDYLELVAGTGISPDERSLAQLITYNLKTYKASLTYKRSIKKLNIILVDASLINQEIHPGIKGNQLQVGIGYQRRF